MEQQKGFSERALVVSLHKAGAHLIARLLQALGYATYGEGLDNQPPHWAVDFGDNFLSGFPARTCFFFHSLPLDQIPLELAVTWRGRYEPPLLFHYRDPRAVLLSLMNYLLKRTVAKNHTQVPYQIMLSDVLSQTKPEDRLQTLMTCFPEYLTRSFEKNLWLLNHPRVCKTSFERLVGPPGGGDAAVQREEIEKVMAHLGAVGNPDTIAAKLFDPNQRTFYKGRTDTWKTAFSTSDLRLFNEKFGFLLTAYGYQPIESAREEVSLGFSKAPV